MNPPQRLDGVIGDLREGDDDTKIRGNVALFVLGLLFFIQSIIIAVLISLQDYPGQSLSSLTGSMCGCLGFWLWAWYLSSANDRKRRLRVALIVFGVACVCLGLSPINIEFFHDRRVEGRAKEWFNQAQADAKPTWTEDDAIRWLRDHDIKPYRSEGSDSEESDDYYVVTGYQQIEEGGKIFRPASVLISFCFDWKHKFQRVEYEMWPFEPPPGANRPQQSEPPGVSSNE